MEPLKLIGWKKQEGKKGGIGYYLFCSRKVDTQSEGCLAGDGEEAVRCYINPEYCKYDPKIGDLIIPVEGRFGIDQIYVVGNVG